MCSSLAEKTFETQELLEQALRCQSPKVVVLDVNVLYWTCKKDAAAFYKLGSKVPVFRYHDRWKSLGGGDFFSLPHYTAESPNRGYLMKTGVEYSSPGDYMQAYPGRGRPGQGSLGYLRQIAQICAREQIPLVLCSVPSAANWNGSRHDAIAQIAQELGVPYVDGNLENMGIDWHTDSPDGGDHMNPRGAAKVTAWIGDYLRRSYGLPDRRERRISGPGWRQRNSPADFFQRPILKTVEIFAQSWYTCPSPAFCEPQMERNEYNGFICRRTLAEILREYTGFSGISPQNHV